MPYLNVSEVESAMTVAAGPPNTSFTQRIALPHLTWEGRTCHALKLGNGTGAGRKAVYFLGGVHAREWGSPDILIFFVEQLQMAYRTGTGLTLGGKTFTAPQIQQIVNTLDILVFPQANPDGRNYSMTVEANWRKNRRPMPPGHTASRCAGVDINRNYDFMWNYPTFFSPAASVNSSTQPCSHDVYIGPSAASEPETQNAVWLMDTYPSVKFFVDLHSYGPTILYNWGDDEDQTTDPVMNFQNPAFNGQRGRPGDAYREFVTAADRTIMTTLATRLRNAIHAVRGTTYTVEQGFSLYATAGTSDDYAFSRHLVDPRKGKIFSFTLEWGTEFHPPYSEMQQIIQENAAGLLDFCLAAMAVPASA